MINRLVKNLLPLIHALIIVAIVLLLSLYYDIYKYPILIDENGVIETLSALGYFVCALLIIIKGRQKYLNKYYYMWLLIVLLGLRELDFDKKFTTMGILKTNFYLSNKVSGLEKLVGIAVILLILYLIFCMIKNHYKNLWQRLKNFDVYYISFFVISCIIVFAKIIDGIPRKLEVVGMFLQKQTINNFWVVEEVLEMSIPFIMIVIYSHYFNNYRH